MPADLCSSLAHSAPAREGWADGTARWVGCLALRFLLGLGLGACRQAGGRGPWRHSGLRLPSARDPAPVRCSLLYTGLSVLGSGVLDSSGFRAGKGPTITRAVSVPLLRRLQRTLTRAGRVSCLLLAATLTEGAFESEKVYFPGYILMIWKMGEQ